MKCSFATTWLALLLLSASYGANSSFASAASAGVIDDKVVLPRRLRGQTSKMAVRDLKKDKKDKNKIAKGADSPSSLPSASPSAHPSMSHTSAPSVSPSMSPSNSPTFHPTVAPSLKPSSAPSVAPMTFEPTIGPSANPSSTPTEPDTPAPSPAGPFGLLRRAHKTHTQHMQMCIEGLDIVECDPLPDGSDGPHVRRLATGERMFVWDEYSVVYNKQNAATVAWSQSQPNVLSAEAPRGADVLDEDDEDMMDMWEEDGFVTEGGVELVRYVLTFDQAARLYDAAEDQRVLVEAGLLPDRWEYLETRVDGKPYAIRQYSSRNKGAMYEETMFLMAEPLTGDEMTEVPKEMAMAMALEEHPVNDEPQPDESKFPDNNRQLQPAVGKELVEFPGGCIDDAKAKVCARISRITRSVAGDLESGYRFDSLFRDSKNRTAELYGQYFAGPSGELTFVQGSARGCATPKKVKVKGLAQVSVVVCKGGDLIWRDNGTIQGGLKMSAKVKAEIRKKEVSVELLGSASVSVSNVGDGKPRFAGIGGSLGVEVSAAGVLSLSADALVDIMPEDSRRADRWTTTVRVRPAVRFSLGPFFRGSFSYTLRVAELGPLQLRKTSVLPPPRVPLKQVKRFRQTQFISPSTTKDREASPDYWRLESAEDQSGKGPEAAVSGFQIVQRTTRRGDLTSIVGFHTFVEREGAPSFSRKIGLANPSKVIHPRVDLDDDEWIVNVAGYVYNNKLYQLTLDTNKGRTFDYAATSDFPESNPALAHRFEFSAVDGEAFYGIDGYTKTTGFSYQSSANLVRAIKDFRALWHKAPEMPCQTDTCVSREATPTETAP